MSLGKIIGIYYIKNLISNKMYIGQSVDIYSRWKTHERELRENKHGNEHLQNAWNKYGQSSFEFNILEKCNIEDLDRKEIEWITIYDSYNNGYNLTLGGEGGIKNDNVIYQLTIDGDVVRIWKNENEIRQELQIDVSVISKCCRKQSKRKSYNGYIWVYEDDYLNNFDLSYYRNKPNNKKINIVVMDLKFNYICEFESVNKTAKTLDIKPQMIDRNIKGVTSRAKNFRFIDKNNYEKGIYSLYKKKPISKNIAQFDTQGNLLKIWESSVEAERNMGVFATSIIACCKGKLITSGNYIWIYYDDIKYKNDNEIEEIINLRMNSKQNKKVKQLDKNNNLIKVWEDVPKASEQLNIKRGSIYKCCIGNQKYAGGFIWEYV